MWTVIKDMVFCVGALTLTFWAIIILRLVGFALADIWEDRKSL